MNKKIKIILILVLLSLFIPCIASASQFDFSNKLIFFEDKIISQQTLGNITVVIGNADIRTNVNGSIIVILGKATINGKIGGDIVSLFGDVDIKDQSLIQGNLVSVGKLKKDSNVKITGTKVA
ncbi:MAG TPA: hypothetical protein VHP38_04120, partial [Ruminiclostridium sp.]|nr:hypothetical protein [Ruminiclostridium sp.]